MLRSLTCRQARPKATTGKWRSATSLSTLWTWFGRAENGTAKARLAGRTPTACAAGMRNATTNWYKNACWVTVKPDLIKNVLGRTTTMTLLKVSASTAPTRKTTTQYCKSASWKALLSGSSRIALKAFIPAHIWTVGVSPSRNAPKDSDSSRLVRTALGILEGKMNQQRVKINLEKACDSFRGPKNKFWRNYWNKNK